MPACSSSWGSLEAVCTFMQLYLALHLAPNHGQKCKKSGDKWGVLFVNRTRNEIPGRDIFSFPSFFRTNRMPQLLWCGWAINKGINMHVYVVVFIHKEQWWFPFSYCRAFILPIYAYVYVCVGVSLCFAWKIVRRTPTVESPWTVGIRHDSHYPLPIDNSGTHFLDAPGHFVTQMFIKKVKTPKGLVSARPP